MIKFKRKLYVQFFVSIKFKYNKIIQIILFFIKNIINYKFKFCYLRKMKKKKKNTKANKLLLSNFKKKKKKKDNFLNLPMFVMILSKSKTF